MRPSSLSDVETDDDRAAGPGVLRPEDGEAAHRVTFIEVFFDVVFIFAFTQLSKLFLEEPSPVGLVETVVLTAAIWWIWVDTTWVTNWLNPEKWPVRALLLVLMALGLTLSSSLPHAFDSDVGGAVFAVGIVLIGLVRTVFAIVAFRIHRPDNARNFVRILVWTCAGGLLWLLGGFGPADARVWIWAAALALAFLGPLVRFRVPGLGGTPAETWDVSGEHMNERVGLFFIIAIGESIIVTGTVFAGVELSADSIGGYLAAFIGSVLLWMLYFNHGERGGRERMEEASKTGIVARNAYTIVPVVMVIGVVLTAVADELVILHPHEMEHPSTAWLICGGPAVYVLGNLLFKRSVGMPWLLSHLVAIAALIVLGVIGVGITPVSLSFAVNGVLAVVVLADEWSYRSGLRRAVESATHR
ncbi:low temperature requirement protein A [Leifsonia flava]|uniref:Low temperature requirement protein A n=1 Tax=Orlajensenia leifsoniae TaxID=2561933 RepID=A0A4Y9R9I8_9MICO|nr:low temperature requirement protein A [Leifsonia flava]